MRAWAGWAAERAGLPDEAAEELAEAVDELLTAYTYEDLDPVGPSAEDIVAVYLDGLDVDDVDPEALPDLLARRQFTMPYYGTRIGDDDHPRLDAGDPDERALLIRGEHPEYHAALADPDPDAGSVVDGVNPRLHLAVHEIVASQLWDDDPPEAWQAAQRLLAAGIDRHDVLHAIGEVVTRHLHGALTGTGPADPVAYVADLARLGVQGSPPPKARRRR
ncbi:hypothetical protein BJF78_31935 [Pseudonocardia sp. CNS-139]|nr:hypothetical protein BJF78_31935 [Pseudonocardia sp. CNS-139]